MKRIKACFCFLLRAKTVKAAAMLLALALVGCIGVPANAQEGAVEPRLQISLVEDESVNFVTIPPEQLGGNWDGEITYFHVKDVAVLLDGEYVKLEDAIRDGKITVEELCAYARIDARKGACRRVSKSKHGLAHFTYRYPDFDLCMTYDIYETPDGRMHLISEFGIYQVGAIVESSYTDISTPYQYDLDREDWGLRFEPLKAKASGITLQCTQKGGQQLGELEINYYRIYRQDTYEAVPIRDGINSVEQYSPLPAICMGGTCELSIDWKKIYGKLEPGSYLMCLNVRDRYNKLKVHPLNQNFHDEQPYWVSFTIGKVSSNQSENIADPGPSQSRSSYIGIEKSVLELN